MIDALLVRPLEAALPPPASAAGARDGDLMRMLVERERASTAL